MKKTTSSRAIKHHYPGVSLGGWLKCHHFWIGITITSIEETSLHSSDPETIGKGDVKKRCFLCCGTPYLHTAFRVGTSSDGGSVSGLHPNAKPTSNMRSGRPSPPVTLVPKKVSSAAFSQSIKWQFLAVGPRHGKICMRNREIRTAQFFSAFKSHGG